MQQRRCTHIERSGEQRPHTHACGVSAIVKRERFGEAIEGTKFADVAGGVSSTSEKVLGKAFLGSGVRGMEYGRDNRRDGARVFGAPSGSSQREHGELDYGVIKEFHSASFIKPLHFQCRVV
jgi:hypothetical protein